MRIALACDHAAVGHKNALLTHLMAAGHEVHDHGTDTEASCDYPDYAEKACRDIMAGSADIGVLVCGTGIGMCIAANKFHGIRCGLAHNLETARLAKQHNNAQMLAIGARQVDAGLALCMVDAWIMASFEPRHQRRLDKIAGIETHAQ